MTVARGWMVLAMLVGLSQQLGCSGPMPYRRMAEAETSLLNVPTQARDQELQVALRRAVVENQALSGLAISPAVYMDRGFVVGSVSQQSQADNVLAVARGVAGLRSVEGYLPVVVNGMGETEQLELTALVKSRIAEDGLPVTRYDVKVIDGTAVLLGVVGSAEERGEVGEAARSTSGVKDVVNFLMVVEQQYGSPRPHLR